jgi:hypothetical protein
MNTFGYSLTIGAAALINKIEDALTIAAVGLMNTIGYTLKIGAAALMNKFRMP